MKKLIIIIIAIFLSFCTESVDRVEIIENIDAEYYNETQVDEEPGTDSEIERMQSDLKEVISEVAKKHSLPAKSYLKYRVYINKKGEVDAIKEQQLSKEFVDEMEKSTVIEPAAYTESIAEKAKEWKFTPALKDGREVKFRTDIEMVVSIDEEGNIEEIVPALRAMGKALSQLSFDRSDDVYFVAVEEQPTPIGGLKSIQEKIKYPEEAKREGVEGRVFVKAYINENGEVDSVELLKGIGSGCDSVAMQAVMETKFTPGKQRGEPVKVQVSIPIVFKLQ